MWHYYLEITVSYVIENATDWKLLYKIGEQVLHSLYLVSESATAIRQEK